MAEALTPDDVVDAALAIVEADGLDALTMRTLASKLGVAVTSIYWHIGPKEELVAAIVERIGQRVGNVRTTGRTPEQRITSTARSLLTSLDTNRALVGLAHKHGALAIVFAPARRALAVEFAAVGLKGAELADAVNAVIQVVAAFSLTEAVVQRSPAQRTAPLWTGTPPIDRAAANRLGQPIDAERSFEVSLTALVRGLLP